MPTCARTTQETATKFWMVIKLRNSICEETYVHGRPRVLTCDLFVVANNNDNDNDIIGYCSPEAK